MPRLVINFFFFQDLRSSHGLNDEMKRLASSNVQQVQTLLRFPGLEVIFLVHLQSFASKIFSASKLVRPQANYFPLFGRHG